MASPQPSLQVQWESNADLLIRAAGTLLLAAQASLSGVLLLTLLSHLEPTLGCPPSPDPADCHFQRFSHTTLTVQLNV